MRMHGKTECGLVSVVIFLLMICVAIPVYGEDVMGDAGGFGIGSASDLTWQIGGGVDYKISKNTIFNFGYRYLEFDYSRGSGLDELGMDLRAQGPYLGLTILF